MTEEQGEVEEPVTELSSFGARTLGFLIDFLPAFIIVSIPCRLAHVKPVLEVSIFYVVWAAYGAIMLWRFQGQTLGMMKVGALAIDEKTGEPPTAAACILRSFAAAMMLAASLLGVVGLFIPAADLLWPNFDPRKQTLHDHLAKTVVVRVASLKKS